MSTIFKARCDHCGEVYLQHEIVRIVKKKKTKTKWRPWGEKETEYEYPTEELQPCPNCGCGTYQIIVSLFD